MQITKMRIRLHGDSRWYEVTSENNIAIASKSIGQPLPKINAVSVDGMDGIIDFTESLGLYFNNRTISLTLTATNVNNNNAIVSEQILGAFKYEYHAKIVDLTFEEEPLYYYTGRLTVVADDYKPTFRQLKVSIDADPYRYAIGTMHEGIPVQSMTNYADGAQLTSPKVDGQYQTLCLKIGGTYSVLWATVQAAPKNKCPYGILTLSNLTTGARYTLNYSSENGHIDIVRGANRNIPVEVDENGGFTAQASTVYLLLKSNSYRKASFKNVQVIGTPETVLINNGDRAVTPTFDALTEDIVIVVNGQSVQLHEGETWNPYFVLKPFVNELYGIGTSGTLTITYEKAVL